MVCEIIILIVAAILFPALGIFRAVEGASPYDCCHLVGFENGQGWGYISDLDKSNVGLCTAGIKATMEVSSTGYISSCVCQTVQTCIRTKSPTPPPTVPDDSRFEETYDLRVKVYSLAGVCGLLGLFALYRLCKFMQRISELDQRDNRNETLRVNLQKQGHGWAPGQHPQGAVTTPMSSIY